MIIYFWVNERFWHHEREFGKKIVGKTNDSLENSSGDDWARENIHVCFLDLHGD